MGQQKGLPWDACFLPGVRANEVPCCVKLGVATVKIFTFYRLLRVQRTLSKDLPTMTTVHC